jgi:hypothetical protein
MAIFIVKRPLVARRPTPWLVYSDSGEIGVSFSGWSAMLDAIEAAQRAGLRDGAASVMVEDKDGSRETRWRYGEDPYPFAAARRPPLRSRRPMANGVNGAPGRAGIRGSRD